MGSRGSPWVRWSWLVVGRRGWGGRGSPWVVLVHCGSVGFDGLAGLYSMVAGLGWFSWWVYGLVELKGMDLGSCVGL